MAMTHERLAVSSGLHTILTNYRFSGSPNLQNPQPTTSLLVIIPVPENVRPMNQCTKLITLNEVQSLSVSPREGARPQSSFCTAGNI